jgi:uncharacterized lipoprotein YmbA
MKLLLLFIAIVLTACANTPETHFYTLEVLITNQTNTQKKPVRTIGIGPLTLPELLNRPQIIMHDSNHVSVAEFHHWALPLKESVLQVLKQNMANLQPDKVIWSYPWSAYGDVQYRVIIDINRFDTDFAQNAVLDVNWAIMQEQGHHIIKTGHDKLTQSLSDASYSTIAFTMSQLLSELSQKLTTELQTLPD